MAKDRLKNAKVRGIACCVPERIVETSSFEGNNEVRNLKKFQQTTGVYRKHVCSNEHVITASDLCYQAAEKLIEELSVERSSIDAVIFVTQSADYNRPATACVLQHRLNLSKECIAYDINLGCSGYPYGLHTAALYLQSGYLKRVLFLAGEAASHEFPEASILFGEAGSATLLDLDESAEDMQFLLQTMGEGFSYLITPYAGSRHGLQHASELVAKEGLSALASQMDGAEIFNFSIREVPRLIKQYLKEFDLQPEDFDVFAFHQANLIILQQIMKRLKLPEEKFPISLDIYGNTSSASVPLAICDYFNRLHPEEKTAGKKKIMVCGYGVGLSLGVAAFSIDGQYCFPVIATNERYEDGM